MSSPGGVAVGLLPQPPAAQSFFVRKQGGGHASVVWKKFTHFESRKTKSTFEHFLDAVSFKMVDKMPTRLGAYSVNAGSPSKNILLLQDLKLWASVGIPWGSGNISLLQEFHTCGVPLLGVWLYLHFWG